MKNILKKILNKKKAKNSEKKSPLEGNEKYRDEENKFEKYFKENI